MPTVRRGVWAEWAGWICKEPEGSFSPDAQRLVDREPPSGNWRGFFFFILIGKSCNNYQSLDDTSDRPPVSIRSKT